MRIRINGARIAGLAISLLAATSFLAACAQPVSGPAAGDEDETQAEQLIILDWAGYDAPQFWHTFAEAHPDVSVDATYFEQDADALAKMQSGFRVDLVHPCSSWWGLYVDAGLVQPIDTSRLENWPDVLPALAELGSFNGQQYFIPYDWGYESILVRTDKIEEMPAAWADLWNPVYAGRLSIPDTAETSQLVAALVLGIEDPWNTSPAEDAAIRQKLIDLKPGVLTYWVDSTELSQMIASGDVWIAGNVWPDTYGTLVQEGVPVEYIEPAEGRLGWVCGYGISSQAEDLGLAHAYLDALLEPASIASMANEFWYGVSNQQAFDLIDPEVSAFFQLDQPDILTETVFYQTMSAEHRQKITTLWDEVKVAP